MQQLRFGVGGGGGGGEDGSSEVERRVLELATLVEDLTYQLSTRNEELEEAVQRGEIAEVCTSGIVKFNVLALRNEGCVSYLNTLSLNYWCSHTGLYE